MPTPHFHDLPDGTTSINHTGEDFWVDIDEVWLARPPVPAPLSPPHPSYANGSAPLTPPPTSPPPVNFETTENPFLCHTFPANAGETVRRPQTATEAPRTARARRNTRRGFSDPDAAIRKDPNAWSLREAVELCKLLEVVLPEAGFHIALTGDLLYKEGKQRDCGLLLYQIRGTEPNHEILWKYLVVAGVVRRPDYPENGWLVEATYRGKAIDCLFPNAKKLKKFSEVSKTLGEKPTTANQETYRPPTPPTPDMEPPMTATEVADTVEAARIAFAEARDRANHLHQLYYEAISASRREPPPTTREGHIINPAWEAGAPILVRHNDGVPEFAAPDFENPASIPEPPF